LKKRGTNTESLQSSLNGAAQSELGARSKPLVFVSHDSRDAELAQAFGNLLTDASGGILKSFRSSDKGTSGIEFGAEWYNTIMSKIRDATDVVALLTQNSIDRPWILYEAGVAKGKLDATVFGVAIGIPLERASTGPFAQFQNSSADEDSLTKLVLQLIERNPEAAPREEAVRRQVKAFLDSITRLLKASTKVNQGGATRVDETVIAKLFEEVKVMFRELPEKVETKLDQKMGASGSRRRAAPSPGLAESLLFRTGKSPEGQAAGWIAFLSTFRESIPWLYEPGLELYRALRSGSPARVDSARREIIDMLESLRRTEVLYMMSDRDRETDILYHELPHLLEHYLSRLVIPRTAAPKRGKHDRGSELPT
jgi:hypothetical protein